MGYEESRTPSRDGLGGKDKTHTPESVREFVPDSQIPQLQLLISSA